MDTPEFRIPPGMCPGCGAILSAGSLSYGEDIEPMPGAFSVCQHCASILRFQRDLSFRMAEDKDFDGAPMEFMEALAEIVASIKAESRTFGKSTPNPSLMN